MARFLGRATFCEGVAGVNLTLSHQEVQDQIGNDSADGATELTARKLASLRVSATPLSTIFPRCGSNDTSKYRLLRRAKLAAI
jgi:hypothetical protein